MSRINAANQMLRATTSLVRPPIPLPFAAAPAVRVWEPQRARELFDDALDPILPSYHTAEEIKKWQREVEARRATAYASMQKTNDAALAAIAKLPDDQRTVIRNATINVGQLDIAHIVGVKYTKERQELFHTAFADALRQAPACTRGGVAVPAGPIDIVEVQEVWLDEARAALREVADKLGYVCTLPDDDARDYGLQILVRKRPDIKILGATMHEYMENGEPLRAAFDVLWGSRRGSADVTLELANRRTINVSTTHLSPLPHYEGLRGRQMVAFAKIHNAVTRGCTYSILGSDMNTPDDTKATRNKWAQATGAANLLQLCATTAMTDAWAATGRPVTTGTMNPHFEQFLNGEFNLKGKRIDYALAQARAQGALLGIVDYRTALNDEYETGEGKYPFSDHLMVTSTYVLA